MIYVLPIGCSGGGTVFILRVLISKNVATYKFFPVMLAKGVLKNISEPNTFSL
jgi:hypothetical protein